MRGEPNTSISGALGEGRPDRVLVIVPTFSNAETLVHALKSISNQTHKNFEAVVISDGASMDCIAVAKSAVKVDARFSLIEKPKSERRGELYRHEVIVHSSAEYITYLADDDLFLPDHLETMLSEIKDFDFVSPFPAFINRRDGVWCLPTNISLESNKQWHLGVDPRNSIALSGVMHTKSAYLRLDEGWATTPSDFAWTDLYMWRKFMIRDDFRLKTSQRSTILKFLGDSNKYDSEKIHQNLRWFNRMQQLTWTQEWRSLVSEAKHQLAAEIFVSQPEYSSSVVKGLEERIESLLSRLQHTERSAQILETELKNVYSSRSWKLTRPLRYVGRLLISRKKTQLFD